MLETTTNRKGETELALRNEEGETVCPQTDLYICVSVSGGVVERLQLRLHGELGPLRVTFSATSRNLESLEPHRVLWELESASKDGLWIVGRCVPIGFELGSRVP